MKADPNELYTDKFFVPKKGICVDGGCLGNPGPGEYRCVNLETNEVLFHHRIAGKTTNNVAEFLAIVHAMWYITEHNISLPIYTDSQTAIAWIRKGRANCSLPVGQSTSDTYKSLSRAHVYLQARVDSNAPEIEIRKWNTFHWGEIPGDFGRKVNYSKYK